MGQRKAQGRQEKEEEGKASPEGAPIGRQLQGPVCGEGGHGA